MTYFKARAWSGHNFSASARAALGPQQNLDMSLPSSVSGGQYEDIATGFRGWQILGRLHWTSSHCYIATFTFQFNSYEVFTLNDLQGKQWLHNCCGILTRLKITLFMQIYTVLPNRASQSRWATTRDHTTSWFKVLTPNCVHHEARMQWILERHVFSIILTTMNSGRRWDSQRFMFRTWDCPHRPQRPSKRSIIVRNFRRKNMRFHFFWTSWLQVLQGKSVKRLKQIFEDLAA